MASARYDALIVRVKELRRCLLPARFSDLGVYHDVRRTTVRALSFRVMAHAEIEAYIEERALAIASSAEVAWQKNQQVSLTTLSLLGFSGHHLTTPPDTLKAPGLNQQKSWPDKVEINIRIRNAINAYVRYVRMDNHGVRERQLMAVLIPLGIAPADLDPFAIADIDNFGRQRGEAAHSSTAGQMTLGVDPKNEYAVVQKIIKYLEAIDALLDGLKIGNS